MTAYGTIPLANELLKKGNCSFIDKKEGAEKIVEEAKLLLRSKINSMRLAVEEFERMINNNRLKEYDYQKFLEKNWWMFGSIEYVGIKAQDQADVLSD